MGELEARKLKYPNTGTEALLMGILIEGTYLLALWFLAIKLSKRTSCFLIKMIQ